MIKNGLNLLTYHHRTISQNGIISTNFWLPLSPQQEARPLGCGARQGCVKTLQALFDMDFSKGCHCCLYPSGRQTKEPRKHFVPKVPFSHLSKKNLAEVRVYRVARYTASMLNAISTSFQRQNTDDCGSV